MLTTIFSNCQWCTVSLNTSHLIFFLQRMLSNSEDECAHSKEEVERLQEEQQTLITKHSEVVAELKEVAEKLVEAEKLHADEVSSFSEG